MNVLGHLALAGDDAEARTGQFLGDFCRGPVEGLPFSPGVLAGVRAHRRVDARGDAHPFIREAKLYLPAGSRRYGGIVLDMLTDWLLHESWDRVMQRDKRESLTGYRAHLRRPGADWPGPARRFAGILVDHDVLSGYAHLSEIRYALGRIGQRLRRPVDLSPLVDPLLRHESRLRRGFPGYFQDMRRAAEGESRRDGLTT
jgi:acyl carrier protein phosphodiesterase